MESEGPQSEQEEDELEDEDDVAVRDCSPTLHAIHGMRMHTRLTTTAHVRWRMGRRRRRPSLRSSNGRRSAARRRSAASPPRASCTRGGRRWTRQRCASNWTLRCRAMCLSSLGCAQVSDAVKRYSFLLGQTELFKHFVDIKVRSDIPYMLVLLSHVSAHSARVTQNMPR